MADLTQIVASIATPSLSSALQHAQELPAGQAIEAKVAQIVSDGLIKLTSSYGTFDLKASHPALQPGVNVRVDISESGNVTLTILPPKVGTTTTPAPQQLPSQPAPAVITTLSNPQAPLVAAPATYSATGQTVQQVQSTPGAPLSPAPVTNTPAAAVPLPALSAALSQALGKQNSVAPLIANLDTLTKLSKPLPQSLQAAIEDVLQSFPLSQDVTPQTVEQAVKRSGVFFESALAQAFVDDPSAPIATQDFKAALLKLETVLGALTKEMGVSVKPEAQTAARLLPPHGTDAPEAQPQGRATLSAQSTQQDIVSVLSSQTDSALARVRVLQFASLPATQRLDQQARPTQVWHLDIPMLINGQAGVIPLQIEREAEKRSEAEQSARRWRVRFAFDLSDLGAVHALLVFGSGLLDVTLWAEREQTYAMFRNMAKDLHTALVSEELEVAEIEFRAGSPREAARRAGAVLDTRT